MTLGVRTDREAVGGPRHLNMKRLGQCQEESAKETGKEHPRIGRAPRVVSSKPSEENDFKEKGRSSWVKSCLKAQ